MKLEVPNSRLLIIVLVFMVIGLVIVDLLTIDLLFWASHKHHR